MGADLGILVCESIAPEVEAVVLREGWEGVQVMALASGCVPDRRAGPGPRPDIGLAPPAGLDLHHIRCGCCPRLALPAVSHDHIAGRRLENCFQLFLPAGLVDQHLQDRAYLVTSGWLDHWPEHLARQGLTDDLARELFGEIARRIVLVDTGIRGDAEDRCREFARLLDLPWGVLHAGLGQITLFMEGIIARVEAARQADHLAGLQRQIQEERASYNLVLDLQRELSSLRDEQEVLAKIHALCGMLYGPGELLVASQVRGRIHRHHPATGVEEQLASLQDFLSASSRADYRLTADGKGFLIRFRRGDVVTGGVRVGRLLFPERRDEYLNQALALAPVCELVIARVRAMQGILPVCAHCHMIRDSKGTWRRFDEYITSHSDILFSHSVCPACLREHYPEDAEDILGKDG